MHPFLPIVDEALAKLTRATLLLADAAKWAEADRAPFNPFELFTAPIKYWKWNKAKRVVTEATVLIDQLRQRCHEARDMPDMDIEISKLDMINDMFELFPFNLRRVGTYDGPSPIKQQLGVDTTVLHKIETTRTTVEHVMTEIGLLHARLRAAS
jgi:hypothetical protein